MDPSIDNLNGNDPQDPYTYKQDYDGFTRNQRREFSIFVDGDLTQETTTLTKDGGGIIRIQSINE